MKVCIVCHMLYFVKRRLSDQIVFKVISKQSLLQTIIKYWTFIEMGKRLKVSPSNQIFPQVNTFKMSYLQSNNCIRQAVVRIESPFVTWVYSCLFLKKKAVLLKSLIYEKASLFQENTSRKHSPFFNADGIVS